MPTAPLVPESLKGRVFRGSWAVATGLLTPNRLRGASWHRLYPDVYVHRDVPFTHALRTCAAAGVLLPGAVVSGRSAAVLWGVDLADVTDDVELTVPPGTNPVRVRGLRVRRARLPPEEVCRRRGVRVTSPAATAVAVASHPVTEEAVMAVDRMVASAVVDLDVVRALAASTAGAGSTRARTACDLADGLAQSPQETRVRLLMLRGGLPRPLAQFVVRNERGFVGRVDFAWPDRKVAVEYDGLWHAEPGQFARDRQRLNRLQAAGWRVVFVTAADLYRPEQLLARIAAALTV
ncbi:endonuclease domain-containing protein [Geodermatophilus ruber]|uniref:T/G mismatch-specific endonuclease n=1 Tax=Geodermatophilus ruber TaxID=504800 RepID=A0A1I4LP50_9ACTN|nr:DUF559 domain-containing protein [Geodermatophilus ruber]SFL92745.1 T/G mismatch-specific endonuclease [Geodermatophilus ruber]